MRTTTMMLSALLCCGTAAAQSTQQAVAPAGSPPQEEALSPYQWRQAQKVAFETSERVYALALKRRGLLSQYKAMLDAYRADKDKAFRIVFGQYLSWYQSFVGDYVGAHDSYSIRQLPASDDAPSPLGGGWKPHPAIETIATLAKGRKAIFFNEAHNVPLTRTLTIQLLARLREDGYTHFAAETLYSTDTGLQQRGYPVADSGFYTMEPICAEMVRTALELGFKVVAYETEEEGNGDVRENAQAKNLRDRVFRDDPDARLVVNAGYAHIQENGRYLGGRSMAQHFRKLTGIDPLTIEQTMLIEHPPGTENHPYYHAVVDKLQPREPIVFTHRSGDTWSLKAKAYDVSVFFPVEVVREGRPTWADLGGMRQPYSINGTLCQGQFPCLVEAIPFDEGSDAIPSDRVVLDPMQGSDNPDDRLFHNIVEVRGLMYLKPGRYRLASQNAEGRVISRRDVKIDARKRGGT